MSVINHKGDHRKQRAREYPPVEEQLDALWKIMACLDAAGVDLGEGAAMLDRVMHVKRAYPKR